MAPSVNGVPSGDVRAFKVASQGELPTDIEIALKRRQGLHTIVHPSTQRLPRGSVKRSNTRDRGRPGVQEESPGVQLGGVNGEDVHLTVEAASHRLPTHGGRVPSRDIIHHCRAGLCESTASIEIAVEYDQVLHAPVEPGTHRVPPRPVKSRDTTGRGIVGRGKDTAGNQLREFRAVDPIWIPSRGCQNLFVESRRHIGRRRPRYPGRGALGRGRCQETDERPERNQLLCDFHDSISVNGRDSGLQPVISRFHGVRTAGLVTRFYVRSDRVALSDLGVRR